MPQSPSRIEPATLWSVVEALQRRLERRGLKTEVVDAAVTRALTDALLRPSVSKP